MLAPVPYAAAASGARLAPDLVRHYRWLFAADFRRSFTSGQAPGPMASFGGGGLLPLAFNQIGATSPALATASRGAGREPIRHADLAGGSRAYRAIHAPTLFAAGAGYYFCAIARWPSSPSSGVGTLFAFAADSMPIQNSVRLQIQLTTGSKIGGLVVAANGGALGLTAYSQTALLMDPISAGDWFLAEALLDADGSVEVRLNGMSWTLPPTPPNAFGASPAAYFFVPNLILGSTAPTSVAFPWSGQYAFFGGRVWVPTGSPGEGALWKYSSWHKAVKARFPAIPIQ